jgi:hypothetical protein
MPNRDVLNFITSGRMSSLRELSIALEYKDWVWKFRALIFASSLA